MDETQPEPSRASSDSDLAACATCGVGLDPLRAARARLIDERFFYFCSEACAEQFEPRDSHATPRSPHPPYTALDEGSTPRPSASDSAWAAAAVESGGDEPPELVENSSPDGRGEASNPSSSSGRDAPIARPATDESSDPRLAQPPQAAAETTLPGQSKTVSVDHLLLASLIGAVLSIVLLLAKDIQLTQLARLALLATSGAALSLRYLRNPDPSDEQRFYEFALAPLLATLLAGATLLMDLAESGAALGFAGTLLGTNAALALVLRRMQAPISSERRHISEQLSGSTWRVREDRVSQTSVDQLRPGEQIVVHAGETVITDVTLSAGKAEIYPWLGASRVHHAGPGDFIYAGARLASGQVRATVRWNGADRHWQRLTNDSSRRADLHAPIVVLTRKLALRGALLAAVAAVAGGVVAGWSHASIALAVLAATSALYNPFIYRLPALRVALTVLVSLRRGIVFKSAPVLEAAGRVATAVFCARGTLLLGEPELSSIDTLADLGQDDVLTLVAGAEQAGTDPVAIAVQRAARAHNVRPDAVRSPQYQAGLGVTAIASNGKPLVVGSRGLMLKEHISVARAEERITELEASGRTVLLVALDNRLVGILALQDGLRAGARAAVQHLLDVGIEPVLLSGDGRETCASVGRTIDIEHIRPDVLPAERGKEIQRLRSGGAEVAVVGRSPTDDIALAAASVSVALPGPGNNNSDFDIELGNDEVQKAAVALRAAHDCSKAVVRSATICIAGGAFGVLCLLALGLPAGWIPVASLAFSLLAGAPLLTNRELDTLEPDARTS